MKNLIKVFVFLLIIFITQNKLLSYDYIGEFKGNRAIVKLGNKWGVIDKDYNEYFLSDHVVMWGKKYKIKEIRNFVNYGGTTWGVKDSPVKEFFLAQIVFTSEFYFNSNGANYMTIDGKILKIKDYETGEYLDNPFIPIDSDKYNRLTYNLLTNVNGGFEYESLSKFAVYYLDSDSNGVAFASVLFDYDKYEYIGRINKNNRNYSDLRLPVSKDNKWGYVDIEGNPITDLKFNFCFQFKLNRGIVITEKNKFKIVDLEGKELSVEFDFIGSFRYNKDEVRIEAFYINVKYENEELYLRNPNAPNKQTYYLGKIDYDGNKIGKEIEAYALINNDFYEINWSLINKHKKAGYSVELKNYTNIDTLDSESSSFKEMSESKGELISGFFKNITKDKYVYDTTYKYVVTNTLDLNYLKPVIYTQNNKKTEFYNLNDESEYIGNHFRYHYQIFPLHVYSTDEYGYSKNLNEQKRYYISRVFNINPLDAIWNFYKSNDKVFEYAYILIKEEDGGYQKIKIDRLGFYFKDNLILNIFEN